MRLFGITAEQAAITGAAPLPRRDESNATGTSRPARSRSDDAALERYLEATKDLVDPLAILDGRGGAELLSSLGAIDDAMLEDLMRQHEPPVLKDGERIGGRKRVRRAQRERKRGNS